MTRKVSFVNISNIVIKVVRVHSIYNAPLHEPSIHILALVSTKVNSFEDAIKSGDGLGRLKNK